MFAKKKSQSMNSDKRQGLQMGSYTVAGYAARQEEKSWNIRSSMKIPL
jgi:hypothetical protein